MVREGATAGGGVCSRMSWRYSRVGIRERSWCRRCRRCDLVSTSNFESLVAPPPSAEPTGFWYIVGTGGSVLVDREDAPPKVPGAPWRQRSRRSSWAYLMESYVGRRYRRAGGSTRRLRMQPLVVYGARLDTPSWMLAGRVCTGRMGPNQSFLRAVRWPPNWPPRARCRCSHVVGSTRIPDWLRPHRHGRTGRRRPLGTGPRIPRDVLGLGRVRRAG